MTPRVYRFGAMALLVMGCSSKDAVPCLGPCEDADGTMLVDVDGVCTGDDARPNSLLRSENCCHGLTCLNDYPGHVGTCARVPTVAAAPICASGGNEWLYQCTGMFVSTDPNFAGMTTVQTLQFTGPPPSMVNYAQGLGSWMKIKFAAAYPFVIVAGLKFTWIKTSNCMPIGPLPSVP